MKGKAAADGRELSPLDQPPPFSVVIPVDNCDDGVGQAVESVLEQSVPPCEILVCDDGSTDDLAGALSPYRAAVTLLRHEHNGVAATPNPTKLYARLPGQRPIRQDRAPTDDEAHCVPAERRVGHSAIEPGSCRERHRREDRS